jgi:hypothetical protein
MLITCAGDDMYMLESISIEPVVSRNEGSGIEERGLALK